MTTRKTKVSPEQGTLPFDDLASSNGASAQEESAPKVGSVERPRRSTQSAAKRARVETPKTGEKLNELLDAAELKRANDLKAAEGRITKRKIAKIKSRVIKFEKTNNSRVLVFASGASWYKMCGNSALIYAHILAPKLGRKVTIRNDTDFENKSREGIISIKYLELLKTDLSKIGVEVEDEDEDMVLFALKRPLSEAEMKSIRHIEEDKINRVNQIVRTKDLYPSVTTLLRKIAHRFYALAKAGDKTADAVILNELARKAIGSVASLMQVANGFEAADKTLRAIQLKNEYFKAYVMMLMELNEITSETALKIEADLAELGVQLDAEIRKIDGGGRNVIIAQGERATASVSTNERLRDGNADGGTGYNPEKAERVAGTARGSVGRVDGRYIPGGGGFKSTTRVR